MFPVEKNQASHFFNDRFFFSGVSSTVSRCIELTKLNPLLFIIYLFIYLLIILFICIFFCLFFDSFIYYLFLREGIGVVVFHCFFGFLNLW